MEMPAVVVLCSYLGLSFPSPQKIMSYCFSHIYFSHSTLSEVVSSLLFGGVSRAWSVTAVTWPGVPRRVLWALSRRAAVWWWLRAHPFRSSCLRPWKWGQGWCGLGVASFGSEPRAAWGQIQSQVSLGPSDSPASYRQYQPEETLLAPELNPLILWVRKLRLRERPCLALRHSSS